MVQMNLVQSRNRDTDVGHVNTEQEGVGGMT